MADGWLEQLQPFEKLPERDVPLRRSGLPSPLKDRLQSVRNAGEKAVGRVLLIRKEPLDQRKKLSTAVVGYRKNYPDFQFEVRRVPGEEAVGLFVIWNPQSFVPENPEVPGLPPVVEPPRGPHGETIVQ